MGIGRRHQGICKPTVRSLLQIKNSHAVRRSVGALMRAPNHILLICYLPGSTHTHRKATAPGPTCRLSNCGCRELSVVDRACNGILPSESIPCAQSQCRRSQDSHHASSARRARPASCSMRRLLLSVMPPSGQCSAGHQAPACPAGSGAPACPSQAPSQNIMRNGQAALSVTSGYFVIALRQLHARSRRGTCTGATVPLEARRGPGGFTSLLLVATLDEAGGPAEGLKLMMLLKGSSSASRKDDPSCCMQKKTYAPHAQPQQTNCLCGESAFSDQRGTCSLNWKPCWSPVLLPRAAARLWSNVAALAK